MKYELWQGDLDPLALDLTGITDLTAASTITSRFIMAQADGTKRVSGPITIPDPTLTQVIWTPLLGDTDTPGVYRAVFKIVDQAGAPETFPSDDVLYVLIRPAL